MAQRRYNTVNKRSSWVKSTCVKDGESFRLKCPHCGCEKVVGDIASDLGLGTKAKCWECGHEFVLTDNRWELD